MTRRQDGEKARASSLCELIPPRHKAEAALTHNIRTSASLEIRILNTHEWRRSDRLPSLTIENYVKAIYKICAFQDGTSAATGQVALELVDHF